MHQQSSKPTPFLHRWLRLLTTSGQYCNYSSSYRPICLHHAYSNIMWVQGYCRLMELQYKPSVPQITPNVRCDSCHSLTRLIHWLTFRWEKLDSNQRCFYVTDLQSAAIAAMHILPYALLINHLFELNMSHIGARLSYCLPECPKISRL